MRRVEMITKTFIRRKKKRERRLTGDGRERPPPRRARHERVSRVTQTGRGNVHSNHA